ncbi:hypothetical protein [Nocardia thailandica]
MFDPKRPHGPSADLVDTVIKELVSRSGADPETIMIIGAHCRDLLHAAFGRADPLRSTSDVDLGIAVAEDGQYRQIVSVLAPSGTTDIRYAIAGITVDVVPFGDIEDPEGTTTLQGRKDSLDVFGFREVFAHVWELRLPSGHTVRVPTPAGYTALKLKAWCDRSIIGEYKDAGDIAIACSWYQEDTDGVHAALYEDRTDLLVRAEVDVDVAALYLLGEEISTLLGRTRTADLRGIWIRTDRDLLAEYFARQRSRTSPDRPTAHRAIGALTDFLSY